MRGTPVAAATSRATPNTLKKSGRLGSTSMSSTASSSLSRSLTSSPTPRPSLSPSTRMPSCVSAMFSSLGEQSMPLDITPRSRRGASGSGRTGTREPGLAQGTRSPAAKFRTPAQTICSPVPSSTLATQSLSESG